MKQQQASPGRLEQLCNVIPSEEGALVTLIFPVCAESVGLILGR